MQNNNNNTNKNNIHNSQNKKSTGKNFFKITIKKFYLKKDKNTINNKLTNSVIKSNEKIELRAKDKEDKKIEDEIIKKNLDKIADLTNELYSLDKEENDTNQELLNIQIKNNELKKEIKNKNSSYENKKQTLENLKKKNDELKVTLENLQRQKEERRKQLEEENEPIRVNEILQNIFGRIGIRRNSENDNNNNIETGLTLNEISLLPTSKYEKNDESENCVVCGFNLCKNDTIVKFRNCGHIFHKECIFNYLQRRPTRKCPICNVNII